MLIHGFHFIRYASIYMTISIDFTWQKDASGYRLVKKGSLPGARPTIDTIMPNGGARILIHPMEVQNLYEIFSYINSAEGLLGFVQRFGLLAAYEGKKVKVYHSESDKWHHYEGMPVRVHLKQAALFREALELKAKGPEHLAAFLESNSGPPNESQHPVITAILKSRIPFGLGILDLIADRTLGARFQIKPTSLMQALWFQLGEVLTSNVRLSTCLHCGQLFEAGVGTGRRADAKFCSDEHRTLYHSLNRKPARRS